MRQLVTIRKIKSLEEIPNSDFLELAKIDGWQCVVRRGDFKVGDEGIFCEIDSILPTGDPRWAFLEDRKFRIRTVKLRGALSQGLLMSRKILTREEEKLLADGESLTDILGVQFYQPPTPLGGEQIGNFPTHLVPKSDQERIQNIPEILTNDFFSSRTWEITEKLDGTSCTFYYCKNMVSPSTLEEGGTEHNFGVCSRNWEMELDDNNVYGKLFKELQLEKKLKELGRNLAIQGEIIGGKVQGNKYKRGAQEFYVFDIYDIDERSYLSPMERQELTKQLELLHVPVVDNKAHYTSNLDDLLKFAEGQSVLYATQREGLVYKCIQREDDGTLFSFKVISNKFLLRNE